MVPSLVLRSRIRQIAHSNSCVATVAAPIFFLAQDLTRGYAWRKRNTFSLSHRQGPHPDSSPAPCRLCGLYTHTWAFSGKPRPAGSAARRPASARTPRLGDVGHPHSTTHTDAPHHRRRSPLQPKPRMALLVNTGRILLHPCRNPHLSVAEPHPPPAPCRTSRQL
jgi:hypothetical protein